MIWFALGLVVKAMIVLTLLMLVLVAGLLLLACGLSLGVRRRKEQLFVWPRLPR